MLMFTNVMIVKSRMEVYEADDYDAGCVLDDYNVGTVDDYDDVLTCID